MILSLSACVFFPILNNDISTHKDDSKILQGFFKGGLRMFEACFIVFSRKDASMMPQGFITERFKNALRLLYECNKNASIVLNIYMNQGIFNEFKNSSGMLHRIFQGLLVVLQKC